MKLKRKFAIASFVTMSLLAASLGDILSVWLRKQLLDVYLAKDTAIVQVQVELQILAGMPLEPMAIQANRILVEKLKTMMVNEKLEKIKLFDISRRLVWSSEPGDQVGMIGDDYGLIKAISGEAVSTLEKSEKGDNGANATYVESYVPLREGHTGRIIGAAEIYRQADTVLAAIRRVYMGIWILIILALAFLYVVLYKIVGSAAEIIRKQTEQLNEANKALSSRFNEFVKVMVSAIDAKDYYTKGHSVRVSKLAGHIGGYLRLPDDEVASLEYAALLHDVGKIGVSDAILNKPGKLDEAEFKEIKSHPEIGLKLFRHTTIFSNQILDVISKHHERFDGTGYPYRLRGQQIPLFARIVAVADSYDAMRTNRPYRSAMSSIMALKEIERNAGTQFDPMVVNALKAVLPRVERELYKETNGARGFPAPRFPTAKPPTIKV